MHPRHLARGALLLLAGLVGAGLALVPVQPALAEEDRELRRSPVVRVAEKVHAAIVSIRTNQMVTRTWYDIWDRPMHTQPYERDGGLGSGAIFHPDGYVITNAHVISRASKIFVGIEGPNGQGRNGATVERRALPLAIDIGNDLAILRLLPDPMQPDEKYRHISIGRSADLMLGETVIAMGHPFRLGLTVTSGIVSGVNRRLELRGQSFDDFMQVDAAINPGNSGGPLFDVTGRWIGVNTAIYNRAVGAEGIGFAIPADRVRSLIATAFKRRVVMGDWLGVEFAEGPDGEAFIERIYPKGPAGNTGLRTKDTVVGLNGRRTPSLYDLRLALVSLPIGAPARLRVRGEGAVRTEREVAVPLQPVPTNRLSLQHLGFEAEDTGEFNGVLVSRVRPAGPADRMTLRKGDVLYGLGQWQIRNSEDLLMFLQFVSPGDIVDVKIRRTRGAREYKLKGSLRAQ